MISDTESQLGDVRRQQTYLSEFLLRMRQAVTEVDLEITSVVPPKLQGVLQPLISGDFADAASEPEEVPVAVEARTNEK